MSLEHLGISEALLSGELNELTISMGAQGVTTNDRREEGCLVHYDHRPFEVCNWSRLFPHLFFLQKSQQIYIFACGHLM